MARIADEIRPGIAPDNRDIWRGVVVPVAALALAMGVAVVGALLTGTTSGEVTEGMEGVSSTASNYLNDFSDVLPLGFAFGAGMVSAVNPCGFTMLPAYLTLYLSDGDDLDRRTSAGRLGRAVLVGLSVTAGFTALFAAIGLTIGFGARSLVDAFPWIGLGIGGVLGIGGAWMLSGRTLYNALGERIAERIGDPREQGVRSYFLFGMSYGIASLSCTLPIFLTVVGGSIAVSNVLSSAGQFVLYGIGMGSVIMALTLSMAVFKAALIGVLRRINPYIEPIGAVALLAAGSYIVYYWLTQGELLDSFA